MATDDGRSNAGPFAEAHDMTTQAQDDLSNSRTLDKDDGDTCRICRGEGTADEPLFFPCKCSGSIKYVHQECLMEWLSHTQKKHCELCKTSFRFTKLYHPGMPNRIPTTVFVRRAALHVLNVFVTWCRGVLVAAVWLFLLPWCMRMVWSSLFWVGDGGWSRDMFTDLTEPAEIPRPSHPEVEKVRSALEAVKATNTTQNLTLSKLLMSISYSPSNATAGDSAFWTFAKRVLFGVPYPFAQITHFSTPQTNQTGSNSTLDPLATRSPSLLSDIPFFNWFQSQTANRFIIDVLEGQIITLFVVVAFILIFLIREWVVQQQPVINMVALGDNAAAAQRAANQDNEGQQEVVAEENEAHGAQPARDDEVIAPGEAVADIDAQEPPEPTIRHTDDMPDSIRRTLQSGSYEDIAKMFSEMGLADSKRLQDSIRKTLDAESAKANPNHDNFDNDEPGAPFSGDVQASSSSSSTFPNRTSNFPGQTEAHFEEMDAESPNSLQRPNMPARGRSFIATEIRRSLEEGNSWSFENLPQASQRKAADTPESWEDDDTEDERPHQEHEVTSDQEPESEHSSESWQQVSNGNVEDDSDQALEGARPQDKGKAKAADDYTDDLSRDSTSSSTDNVPSLSNETNVEPTTEVDMSSNHAEHDSKINEEQYESNQGQQPTVEDATAAGQAAPVEPVQAPQNPFNLVLDWMFGDVAPAVQVPEAGGNDEHVVRNIAEEAPFVPFVGNEPRENGHALIQDPEVAAAAAQAGIDVNDQEAIEDAEDLEGILELIGMQGPLIGLFQNALFSAVLISATLSIAVWLPYLLGKVVILFMGSPISLFIKLPLQLVATMTDLIVDVTLFLFAGATYWSSQIISTLVGLCSWGRLSQAVEGPLRAISTPAQSLAESALDRIGKLIVESPLTPRPDYFRLSINSHAALRSLQNSTSFAMNETSNFANIMFEKASADSAPRLTMKILSQLPHFVQAGLTTLYSRCSALLAWVWTSKSYKITFDFDLGQNTTAAYTALERWTASDRMIAIMAGYGFFAMAGAVYLKRGTPFSTSQQGQKIEQIVSDILQQAGGVLKVILIISIEMLAFPLYCGLLLDLAMLPLFKDATLYTRWQFARESPWTSGFVHWFLGTCYMFHFALFVSLCRKIMRKGVLYFIRDPDDPTFHPVRDVLERSVTTQLRKIAFSALVYGALVIVCLGGVVWSLSRATSDVLPIHWTTEAPSLEFPLDLLFYNFLTPVIIKFYKPSEGLHTVFQWWFKKCASFLRLSSFLFGVKVTQQEGDDGKYVRAPASDQARIPKGQPVFVEVDKDNVRKDGKTEGGVHNSDLVTVVYIPPWYRVRIFAFVVTIWIFMGMSGVGVTILPLLFGRYLFSLFLPPTVEMNDIHAFSLGIYTLGSLAYSAYHAYKLISSLNRPVTDPMSTLHTVGATTSRVGLRVLRFTYVWASLIFAIPFLFAVLIELYFLMPLHAYLGSTEPHVVHLIQDWTLGFLYARLTARIVFANRNSRPARAFTAVVRDGYLYPNAGIATRCFLLPVMAMFLVAIAIPSSLAFVTSRTMYWGASQATKSMVWRFSFPAVGLSLGAMWASKEVVRLLVRWRLVVRDEVYLIGERLHNFGEKKAPVQPTRPVEDKVAQGATESVATQTA
ncbi:RING finger membrane protein [Cucurbitaria berberidis CBS 394.84]|uniref:RING-type E3 ubiquitin transferase n=1 Tax=Cucurbitaria berberidis CBS 394.84 TaxID=1168544 RepID=A0A9P4G718_9PLEO|nr:RING finger membrane protein [Cucurbitaria berberidis CBS 394.84]KAF1840132.1 RING finger membrane protein [Cucurbitaria berberidis CBS 394.84]